MKAAKEMVEEQNKQMERLLLTGKARLVNYFACHKCGGFQWREAEGEAVDLRLQPECNLHAWIKVTVGGNDSWPLEYGEGENSDEPTTVSPGD
jgi:hypothetical protein